MMNEDNNQKLGSFGGFKVKLKKGGDDTKYLTSTDNGTTLKWSSTDTPVMFQGDKDGPPKNWYIVVNRDMKFLAVSQGSVSVSGNCSDSGWQDLNNDKLPFRQANDLKYLSEDTNGAVVLDATGKGIECE